MNKNDDVTHNEISTNLTYSPWCDYILQAVYHNWIKLFIYVGAGFGACWGLIEAVNFFFPNLKLNSGIVLGIVLAIIIVVAFLRIVYDYGNSVPLGLENEKKEVQKIAIVKKPFWEYALAYELLKKRIEEIDKKLDDLDNNRTFVRVTKSFALLEYIEWLSNRPTNLMRMVNTEKQLLVYDLSEALNKEKGKELDFKKLVKVIEQIENLYQQTYDFDIEAKQIKIPESFEFVHSIQYGWTSVIRNGVKQMLEFLHSVSLRKKDDFSEAEINIKFDTPPRIDEFCTEMDRLENELVAQAFFN